ncbi:DNA cytosine methyltransferase [Bacillus phage Hobo]|uniref:Cytosine-C5 specific DNA methylase n=2 Tax=Caeruleovirus BM15 TaxID=1985178 RepID=A0A0S2MUI6_9CAUD|nr:DNA methyltransferase [Bacillus phage BM15]ALO79550.1 cytosine-C5 specific DNA methylase [Bacillus phage BM15]AXQ66901.1 DNA cytosine methyltransferase [Bacillus phage Hobo]
MEKLKLLSLFSGIGAFEKAFKNLNIPYELVAFSEIDPHAIKAYCAIHNERPELNIGDITQVDIDKIPEFDMMTYGFPCTDISIAGDQDGFDEGSNTRSSTLWDAMKIAEEHKPKYMIAENVDNLLSSSFEEGFNKWLARLNSMGYNTYYKLLNSLDYNVPQNRERVFVISIRKDIDKGTFQFPTPVPLQYAIQDILEDESTIAERYYLSKEYERRYLASTKLDKFPMGKVYTVLGTTVGAGKGTNWRSWVYDITRPIGTLTATDHKQPKQIMINGKLRKLTPLEYWLLMGFDQEDYLAARSVKTSNTQMYRQAGNSIVVDVAERILHNLFKV